MFRTLSIAALMLTSATSFADQRAKAVRRTGAVTVDGHLDEATWTAAAKYTGFTQRYPKDGGKAAHGTSFAIVYVEQEIYVAAWATAPEPSKIRPPIDEYSPSVFSRTTQKSISPGSRPASGQGTPGISRTGRRLTY